MRQQPLPWDHIPKQLKLSLPLAALAIGLVASCARGQLFGSPPSRDVEEGAQVAKLVEQQIGLYSQPEAQAYLRKVGDRLATVVNDPRWKFSFQIVDQAEPNAFSIPGGGVYVSRGLLALIDREDELACVLAHESPTSPSDTPPGNSARASCRTCSRCRETWSEMWSAKTWAP